MSDIFSADNLPRILDSSLDLSGNTITSSRLEIAIEPKALQDALKFVRLSLEDCKAHPESYRMKPPESRKSLKRASKSSALSVTTGSAQTPLNEESPTASKGIRVFNNALDIIKSFRATKLTPLAAFEQIQNNLDIALKLEIDRRHGDPANHLSEIRQLLEQSADLLPKRVDHLTPLSPLTPWAPKDVPATARLEAGLESWLIPAYQNPITALTKDWHLLLPGREIADDMNSLPPLSRAPTREEILVVANPSSGSRTEEAIKRYIEENELPIKTNHVFRAKAFWEGLLNNPGFIDNPQHNTLPKAIISDGTIKASGVYLSCDEPLRQVSKAWNIPLHFYSAEK